MKKSLLSLSIASCLLALSQSAWAEKFIVKDIQVNGIQRVDPGTVLANIPIKAGETYQDFMTADIVRSLYKTGLFDDVSLQRNGNILVVNVHERMAVGEINITGNKLFETKQLLDALKRGGIRRGQTLNRSALARIQHQIKQQYLARGKYGVNVTTDTSTLARGRVAVNIKINEGADARIGKVRISGNKAFPEKTLLKLLDSGTRKSYQFFSDKDKYSREKLVGDIDKLTSFYRDQGFLKFEVTDTQVTLSPDKKFITVNIAIKEGDRYRVGNVDVNAAPGVSVEQARSVLKMRKGQVFSQKKLEESRKALRNKVSEGGHAFARVGIVPQIDEAGKIVNIRFESSPGKRVYVRRINIRGNYRTRDEVYRREMRQLESSWFSRQKVERSKVRLQRLPYVQSVKISQVPVAGTKDQIDLEVTVAEQLSNQFTAGVGFSQSQGVIFNVGLKQQNFLGSGKSLGVNANNSSATKRFSLNYFDPYHTVDGIGRGFDVHYNRTDTDTDDLISSYLSDSYGANLNYTIPLSEENSLRFSVGFEHRKITAGTNTPQFIKDFIDPANHGNTYNELLGTVSYVHDTRDRSIFPTTGSRQSIAFEAGLPGSDLEYYKVRYKGANYWPVTEKLTFAIKGGVSYGDGYGDSNELPFFERFFSGGIGSVRGFEKNTLGVKDSFDNAEGGEFVVNGTAELSFPAPFAEDIKGLRLNAFVDAGNVFKDFGAFDSGDIKYSVGVGATWLSPLGPLTISYAKPFNVIEGQDDEQQIQFSIGATF